MSGPAKAASEGSARRSSRAAQRGGDVTWLEEEAEAEAEVASAMAAIHKGS